VPARRSTDISARRRDSCPQSIKFSSSTGDEPIIEFALTDYMWTFAETYPGEKFVQQVVAQIPWGHNVWILDYVKAL
jgi:hypothetical protein